MTESRNVSNGADQQSEHERTGRPQSLINAGRQLQSDAKTMASHAQEASSELQTYVTQQVRQRPVVTLAAAAGIGYVLGGGLSSKLTLLMLGMATRFGMAIAAREMSVMATEGGARRTP